MRLLFLTTLSAISFSLPFVFSALGFLVLFFLIPLLFLKRNHFRYGFIWGMIAYGINYIWFYILLINKSTASIKLATVIYIIILTYSALTSAIWFYITDLLSKIIGRTVSLILSSVLYFYTLDKWMFWFFGTGYPFLNPIIPLMNYPSFRRLLCYLLFITGINSTSIEPDFYHLPKQKSVTINSDYRFVYLKPCSRKGRNLDAYEVYKNLKSLKLERNKDKIFVLGPETTYPYALRSENKLLSMWASVMPNNASLLLGTGRGEGKEFYQTVCQINKGLIINYYDKTHRVPFVERLPRYMEWASFLFDDKVFISKGKNLPENEVFTLGGGFTIKPVLCSELFMKKLEKVDSEALVAFVNDDWFCSYFRHNLTLLARLKGLVLGAKVLFVGHQV